MRLLTLAQLIGICLAAAGCQRASSATLGDAGRGAILINQQQCGSCHAIPGVPSADGMSGPPLRGFADRTMIAGVIANTPRNLVDWLRAPQAAVPGNAMPDMGLSRRQARDVAAYLDTLR